MLRGNYLLKWLSELIRLDHDMANRINSVSNHMRIEPHSARTGRSCHVSIPLVRLKPRRVLFLSRMLDHGLNHRSTVLPKLPYRSTD